MFLSPLTKCQNSNFLAYFLWLRSDSKGFDWTIAPNSDLSSRSVTLWSLQILKLQPNTPNIGWTSLDDTVRQYCFSPPSTMERISVAAHQRCVAADLLLVPQKLCLTTSILLRAIPWPCRVKARQGNFLRFSKTARLRALCRSKD